MLRSEMSDPLVSVAIPCFNHEMYIEDCIQSVIDQEYRNIELIIIDDGSSDSSVSRIEGMRAACQARFNRFEIRSRSNRGLSSTLNEALEWSKGKYFSPVASDDMLLSSKTSVQVEYLERNPSCAAVFGGVQIIDEKNNAVRTLTGNYRSYDFRDILLHRYKLSAPTQLLSVEALRKVGGYDTNHAIEDWSIMLRLTAAGYTLDAIPQVFSKYRRHPENMSKRYGKMLVERLKIMSDYRDDEHASKAMSVIYIMSANDVVTSSKRSSLRLLYKALNEDLSVLWELRFIKLLLKLALPISLVRGIIKY